MKMAPTTRFWVGVVLSLKNHSPVVKLYRPPPTPVMRIIAPTLTKKTHRATSIFLPERTSNHFQ
jgi:hypothetical protein